MKIERKYLILILLSLVAVFIESSILTIEFSQLYMVYIAIAMLLVVYFIVVYIVANRYTVLSLQFYSIFGIGIFNIGIFVQFLMDNSVFYNHQDLTLFHFENEVIIKAIICLSLFLLTICIVFLLQKKVATDEVMELEYRPFFL